MRALLQGHGPGPWVEAKEKGRENGGNTSVWRLLGSQPRGEIRVWVGVCPRLATRTCCHVQTSHVPCLGLCGQ